MNYSEAYKALATCPTIRERVLQSYHSLGGINHRWMASDQSKMAQALTKVEDEIETEKKNQEHREALKVLRRELENTLEP